MFQACLVLAAEISASIATMAASLLLRLILAAAISDSNATISDSNAVRRLVWSARASRSYASTSYSVNERL